MSHFFFTWYFCKVVIVNTPTQPQLNLTLPKLGLTRNDFGPPPPPTTHHPPTQTQCYCYWPDIEQTLKGRILGPLERISTVTVQATFVHIKNILAISDQILTKIFGPNFFGALIFCLLIFFCPKFCLTQYFF